MKFIKLKQAKKLSTLHINLLMFGIIIGITLSFLFQVLILKQDSGLTGSESIIIENYIEDTLNISSVKKPSVFEEIDLANFWTVWALIEKFYIEPPEFLSEEGKEVEETADTRFLKERFKERKITRERLLQSAIAGLARTAKDPYTSYFIPKQAKEFKAEIIDGEIEGIGAYLSMKDGLLKVVNPIKNGPAEKAGLKINDIILKIDNISVGILNFNEAIDLIRGPRGEPVDLMVKRAGELDTLVINIIRDKIEIPSVTTKIQGNVFILSIKSMVRQTSTDVKNALIEFSKQKQADRIILDLRSNTGGLLTTAIDIASFFVPKGSIILYEYTGSKNLKRFRTNRDKLFTDPNPKIAILVDGATASSAEILAAALNYHKVGSIIGTETFGKGSVQSLKTISDKSILKITIAHWLTPEKKSISEKGITPEFNLIEKLKEKTKEQIKTGEVFDISSYVLEEAIRIINEQ